MHHQYQSWKRPPFNLSVPIYAILAALLALFISPSSIAQTGNTAAHLKSLVIKNSNQLVAIVNKERKVFATDPERFYTAMDDSLGDMVDFKIFTLRVMGRFARRSTLEQRKAFLTVFKRSLFNAYAKALVESGKFTLSVHSVAMNPRSNDRATVSLEVVTDQGSRYQLLYAMSRNNFSKKWLVQNVIVSGINIGLAFRDRFEQQMRFYKNNMNQVIKHWSGKLKGTNSIKSSNKR